MDFEEKELELLEAARDGINKYLSSTRGARIFGAGAKVEIIGGDRLVTTSKKSQYILFSGRRLL